jgi:RNA polymerase sigma-70 factor (ECF subfamily)
MTDADWKAARSPWRAFSVGRDTFEKHALERSPKREHLADLYLAFACWSGDRGALAAFERLYIPEVASYLRHPEAAFVDEVKQALRERLFVGAAPRIAAYTGRGPLGAWLRTVAIRLSLNLRANEKTHARRAEPPPSAEPDPELDYLKHRYRPVFREALAKSLAELPVEDRNRLRFHFLDGLTATQIASLERVAVSTVTRGLERARRRILDETRRHFADRLSLSRGESQSMMRLVRSHLGVSIRKFLEQ